MTYRQTLHTSAELATWYTSKYAEMGGCWHTPAEELDRHLDDFGVLPATSDYNRLLFLEIGCGAGSMLDRIRLRGHEGLGTEIVIDCCLTSRALAVDICERPFIIRFDRVLSLGSLEHVIDIDAALANIHASLVDTGRWYFFVPNELWAHDDQPNERTAPDHEWIELFARHGLIADSTKRWNDSTAIQGHKQALPLPLAQALSL